MKYAVKVKCVGYTVATVEAESEQGSIDAIEGSSFYLGNDEFDVPCDAIDTDVIWSKPDFVYSKECEIAFNNKFEPYFRTN